MITLTIKIAASGTTIDGNGKSKEIGDEEIGDGARLCSSALKYS